MHSEIIAMNVRVIFDATTSATGRAIWVESTSDWFHGKEARAGQVNGMCGAAVPGALLLKTGAQEFDIAFRVELYDVQPAVDMSWDDIVEASFRPLSLDVFLVWDGGRSRPIELALTDYRVRYSAKLADLQSTEPGEAPPSYLLQFWPAERESDTVIKQTSETAAYWNSDAANRRRGDR
jgi:hypothetical protein